MHPMMITALASEVEKDRARESRQASLRSLALEARRTCATKRPTGWRLLVLRTARVS